MSIGRYQTFLAAQILLLLGNSGSLVAAGNYPETNKPAASSLGNPYYGYRPRDSDRRYSQQPVQEKANASLGRDACTSGVRRRRQAEQADCLASPWAWEEDRGYRPRGIPSPEPDGLSGYRQQADLPYTMPRGDDRMSVPAYAGIGVHDPFLDARRLPPVYDPRLYQSYPIILDQPGNAVGLARKKPWDSGR